jgi:hypothetical protein
MRQSPYKQARRVFWVMDNGSSHRGDASVQPPRLRAERIRALEHQRHHLSDH